ncbi:hypothetical protein [Myxococcus sp. CA039A]|uniref:TPR end-of-group domain-containing protein n=1 Tax=Myxococcus sp. CA039A TaxID=2741737 RepID=UPI00157A502A|nr:hypothetical protein [Myxococcus sp. CA039A]NTX50684.1 hypothetical protein [Myxococcus sp. CA039A]
MRRRIVSGVCLATWSFCVLSACASTSSGSAAPSIVKPECGEAPRGLEALLKPGGLVLFGEMHGTEEVPRFVGDVACHASVQGLAVRVGLEIPSEEQGPLDAFLAADDAQKSQADLLLRPFWMRDVQDGRSSKAMLQLLSRLRELRRSGAKLTVVAFDVAKSADRDGEMAKNLLAALSKGAEDLTLVLAGNLHVRLEKGTPWDANYTPMGWHLAQAKLPVTSLNNSYTGGSAWVCMGQNAVCSAYPMKGKDKGERPFVEHAASVENGYHGVFHVGAITASLPAVESKQGAGINVQAVSLRAQGDAAYDAKQFAQCAKHFAEAARVDSSKASSDAYNEACCHSLAKDSDAAITALQRAAKHGYSNWQHVRRDEDLAPLRADARWAPLMAQVRANLMAAAPPGTNAELYGLYLDDQDDRQDESKIDWAVVGPRDVKRLARARQLLEEGKVQSAKDSFHAALLFHHGKDVADFKRAHTLLLKAVELDPKDGLARWLTAAAEDRLLTQQGKPQRYGTQREQVNGKWRLVPVDPSVSDEERAKWGVPPLKKLQTEVEAANATPP